MFLTFMNKGESENINVNPESFMSDIVVLYSQKVNVSPHKISLTYQGNVVDLSKTPKANKIIPGSVLIVYINENAPVPVKSATPSVPHPNPKAPSMFSDSSSSTNHSAQTLSIAKHFCDKMLADSARLAQIFEKEPLLAQSIVNRDYPSVATFLKKFQQAQDPGPDVTGLDEMSPEYQKRVEEYIRDKNIQSSLQTVIEHHPEIFVVPDMLYIHAKIKDIQYTCFVDTGAQTTIMSKKVAVDTGLIRLVDKKFSTVLRGVGEDKSLGRIHLAKIEIGGRHLPTSFVVVNNLGGIDILIGLDMLKRHQANINLKDNTLSFSSDVGQGCSVPFLNANEIPRSMFHGGIGSPAQSLTDANVPTSTGVGSSATKVKSESPPNKVSDSLGFGSSPSASSRSSSQPVPVPQQQPKSGNLDPVLDPETAQKVKQMEILGINKKLAIAALRQANGNLELAIDIATSM